MKKLISFVLSIVMVFACFAFADVSPPADKANFTTYEKQYSQFEREETVISEESAEQVFVQSDAAAFNNTAQTNRKGAESSRIRINNRRIFVGQEKAVFKKTKPDGNYSPPLVAFTGFAADHSARAEI